MNLLHMRNMYIYGENPVFLMPLIFKVPYFRNRMKTPENLVAATVINAHIQLCQIGDECS